MYQLVESIRSEDGKLLNIRFHNERIIMSLWDLFRLKTDIDLEKLLTIPETAKTGIFKCRIEYDTEIRKVEFIPYTLRIIKSLKVVEDNKIDYAYKFADRQRITELLSMREKADDILIIKNRLVTDTSSANVVFRDIFGNWITPSTFLLPGTKRASLLKSGRIKEAVITIENISKYIEVKLINAMIGLEDTEGISISNLL